MLTYTAYEVWMADDAIPRLVTRKMKHSTDLVVSANIINNPPLGFLHYHMGALHPYFPDTSTLVDLQNAAIPWRPSYYPTWEGPASYTWTADQNPPHKGHRWLRVKEENMMSQTPAAELKYEVWGTSYESWAIAAQVHYSLLENIEKNELELYKFRAWTMHGDRIRINFMCFYADDILDTGVASWPKDKGDEVMIVLELPMRLNRCKCITTQLVHGFVTEPLKAVTIEGKALGAHFQYSDQGYLADTDLLARYQSLANERACRQYV